MSHPKTLNIVLYWHMHQPEYRDLQSGEFQLPWVYLHAIKDYTDMAAHLENNPDAKAVVNFAPILLEQIDEYAHQLSAFIKQGTEIKDPLLYCLSKTRTVFDTEKQKKLIKTCSRANKERLIDRFEAFQELYNMAHHALENPRLLNYYSEQFYGDILVWYHLAWMGETIRNKDPRIKALIKKARHFSHADRMTLIEVIAELLQGIIPRYKKLALNGQIELSMTPATHPILPLLLDFSSARDAMPQVSLPQAEKYPGGEERSMWHMQRGREIFIRHFGFEPAGCWPSEGSISPDTIKLVKKMGIKWLASGETVLRNSLKQSQIENEPCMHKAYQYQDNQIACFFRDDGLSDLIGFEYSKWHADDAVANLISHFENIAEKCQNKDDSVVAIILDGENAWEYYPFNGSYFLDGLYKKLCAHEYLNLTTFSDYINKYPQTTRMDKLVSGSWVYGTFSTWIGDKDKNAAWDLLVQAKQAYDQVMAGNTLNAQEREAACVQLATCESSDWFWWFGDYNAAESVQAFDQQFRMHLRNLYCLLKLDSPPQLEHTISSGSKNSHLSMGGVMLPGKQS